MLGWMIRDHSYVELDKHFPFDYTYVLFGVWIAKLWLIQDLWKGNI